MCIRDRYDFKSKKSRRPHGVRRIHQSWNPSSKNWSRNVPRRVSHESVLSWGHKKGLHNYEIDYYEHILSAFSKFTTPENARRIYLEGVKILFPKLKEWFFSTAHCEGKTHFLSKYLVFWRVIRNFASHLSITMAFVFPAKCGRGESVAYLSGRKNFIIIPSWFLFPIKNITQSGL